MNSILVTIRQMVVGDSEDKSFDNELIVYINSALSIIKKFGVGLEDFRISGEDETWDEFLGTRTDLDEVKTNVYLRVRLMFDPPQNAFLVTSINEQIKEGNWYIEMYRNPSTEAPIPDED